MKKRAKLAALLLAILLFCGIFAGCNEVFLDTTYEFDRCIIRLPDGKTVSGSVESWKDWDDCDFIQVEVNGKTYYTHMVNVVLIAD